MRLFPLMAAIAATALPSAALAQESNAELAKKLANPVSTMISVPLQNNWDCCYGEEDAGRYTLNVQPVVPFRLNDDWNLIVRTIVPVVWEDATVPGGDESFGFGDVTQSFFFAPSEPKNGLTWAIGPAILYPLGNDNLGTEKWGLGPTALLLKQDGHMSYGILANHIWSVAGQEDRDDVSSTFLQPFFSYTYPDSTGISINTEASYDWEHDAWSIPVNAGISHVYKFGEQRVSLALQGRYWVETPEGGPGAGVRFTATFLFPEK